MITKVRLKIIDRGKDVSVLKITQIAYENYGVAFTRFFPTHDGYKALCRSEEDADKLLQQGAIDLYKENGIEIIVPPEIKAKLTVFIRRLDSQIGDHTKVELKHELEDRNVWLKVDEVIKIGDYTHMLKLRLKNTAMADKVLEHGVLACRRDESGGDVRTCNDRVSVV